MDEGQHGRREEIALAADLDGMGLGLRDLDSDVEVLLEAPRNDPSDGVTSTVHAPCQLPFALVEHVLDPARTSLPRPRPGEAHHRRRHPSPSTH